MVVTNAQLMTDEGRKSDPQRAPSTKPLCRKDAGEGETSAHHPSAVRVGCPSTGGSVS
jgi:hypothetical protein